MVKTLGGDHSYFVPTIHSEWWLDNSKTIYPISSVWAWKETTTVCNMTWLHLGRIIDVCSACFVNENYFWKVLCFGCTALHLSFLFRDFFLTKPTVSSFETIRLSLDILPDVLVCRENAFNITKLVWYGYKQKIYEYIKGFGKNNTFVGLSGSNGSDPLR